MQVMESRLGVNPQIDVFMPESLQSLFSTRLEYRSCFKCKTHPSFPGIPPMTLHEGRICFICQDGSSGYDSANLSLNDENSDKFEVSRARQSIIFQIREKR
jgi:hypothetical protein